MKTIQFLSAILLLGILTCLTAKADEADRPYWALNAEGGITWINDGRIHKDHIEMAGQQMAVVLHYGINAEGRFTCERHLVFPMLRTIPNDTHASFIRYVNWDPLESVLIGKSRLVNRQQEQVESISLQGLMTVKSHCGTIDALYSPRLWTKDGMLTQAESETFWDRSTLYALRGALMAGDTSASVEVISTSESIATRNSGFTFS